MTSEATDERPSDRYHRNDDGGGYAPEWVTSYVFEVVGTPAPQGSKRHVGNGIMRESSKALAPWRATVAQAARMAVGANPPLDGAVALFVTFRFPMPKSRPKALRERGEAWKTTAPDIDKLVRAVSDALTEAGMIHDDARIVTVTAQKHEVVGWTGARIVVWKVGSLHGEGA